MYNESVQLILQNVLCTMKVTVHKLVDWLHVYCLHVCRPYDFACLLTLIISYIVYPHTFLPNLNH